MNQIELFRQTIWLETDHIILAFIKNLFRAKSYPLYTVENHQDTVELSSLIAELNPSLIVVSAQWPVEAFESALGNWSGKLLVSGESQFTQDWSYPNLPKPYDPADFFEKISQAF